MMRLRMVDIGMVNEVQAGGKVGATPAQVEAIRRLPVIPLSMTVLFPHALTPLLLGDEHHAVLDAALQAGRTVLAVARRADSDATLGDIHDVGVEAQVARVMRLPDGTANVLLRGLRRVRITALVHDGAMFSARGEPLHEPTDDSASLEALRRVVLDMFENVAELSRTLPDTSFAAAQNAAHPGALADIVAANLPLALAKRQHILETLDVAERLGYVLDLLRRELDILRLEHEIRVTVEHDIDRAYRAQLLREQLQAIQHELGQHDPVEREQCALRARIEAATLPIMVRTRALDELGRLELIGPGTPEYGVVHTYLDWLLSLPWQPVMDDALPLVQAIQTLDEHHYGLRKAKERIVEYLAVRTLVGDAQPTPILCFVGPPGVGKTSLGRAIAAALRRPFVRVALGGIHDEAEIRGHRRTYVGALPGRIIKAMRDAGATNPVFMLDEIDKLGQHARGNPAAALLEVLDGEQNTQFSDHYLDVPYDLSAALFITTANTLEGIEDALLDRLEVVELPSYSEEEKIAIARRFLIPRQCAANGLGATPVRFSEASLRQMVRDYTFEAGVRQFERDLGAVCRKIARMIAEGRRSPRRIEPRHLGPMLGPPRFDHGIVPAAGDIGVATGLVWTEQGGDIMPIEIGVTEGKGNLLLTGLLGDVMQESAQAALSWTRTNARRVGIDPRRFEKVDIHIHAPEGGVPKDGPSAGITIACALVGALARRPARRIVAMTGEVTLRGLVLPVGGIKEKVLGAYRAGLEEVIVPRRNERDLRDELPRGVLRKLRIHYVETMDEVLPLAFAQNPLDHPYTPRRRKKAPPKEAEPRTDGAEQTR
jgi:ATP-dependent Lon protease